MVNRAVALIIRKTCQLWWFNWLNYGTEILLLAAPRDNLVRSWKFLIRTYKILPDSCKILTRILWQDLVRILLKNLNKKLNKNLNKNVNKIIIRSSPGEILRSTLIDFRYLPIDYYRFLSTIEFIFNRLSKLSTCNVLLNCTS